jgi:hypothetical protein
MHVSFKDNDSMYSLLFIRYYKINLRTEQLRKVTLNLFLIQINNAEQACDDFFKLKTEEKEQYSWNTEIHLGWKSFSTERFG